MNFRISIILIISIAFIFSFEGFSQNYYTKNKKAIQLYQKAEEAFKTRDFDSGMEDLQKAVQKDPNFTDAHYLLARNYQLFSHKKSEYYDLMLFHYEKTIATKPNNKQFAGAYYTLSGDYLKKGEYAKAKKYAETFLSFKTDLKVYNLEAQKVVDVANFAEENIKNPLPFSPKPLSNTVNSSQMLNYFPALTADQNTLIFTARPNQRDSDENIFISIKTPKGEWSSPVSISNNINTAENEGTCSISADGKTIVFTGCQGRKSFGSCDLYISKKYNDQWTEPINMGQNINSPAWDSQPSLSADGKTIFFVSDRSKNQKKDIFISRINSEGDWSVAENLGAVINSKGNDESPFIHVNGKTLYFSSNGHLGFGGFDLFVSENLGYPINNANDQVSLFLTLDGKKAYFTNEVMKLNEPSSSILMEFEMPQEVSIKQKSNYVKGVVYDAKTKQRIEANIDLLNLTSSTKEYSVMSDAKDGKYLIIITQGSEYALEVRKKGYGFQNFNFNYLDKKEEDLKPIEIDIYLDPIAKGTKFILNNIFFETKEYTLQTKSKAELDELIRFMNENPEIKGEISGHTDDIGDDKTNAELSLKRAKSVYDYLIKANIDAQRLTFKGYGKTQPSVANNSDANRQLNRRIEFKIL
jgi:OmpA-OmpF porin, OOP family